MTVEIFACEQRSEEWWEDIPGFLGVYQVSRRGRVRSLPKRVPHWRGGTRLCPGVVLTPRIVKGYCHVTLQHDGQVCQRSVHRLVAEAFISNPDSKPQVNHRDGDKTNNVEGNLEWATSGENNSHAFAQGLRSNRGECASKAVLTSRDVLRIRERLSAGETCVKIAADYPVTDRAISRIKRRVVWGHI